MSAQLVNPVTPPDMVNIEINGQALQMRKGSMIIEGADKIGVPIPRFCYHEKLPIAANCRMCLVDVEKMPKPQPACATPVMEGMKVFTQSKRAADAQRNVMEFLLINHPLDCPVCDQGGECELQDLAVGYGRSVSRFTEGKRVVSDENLGPLISTDMTRCIHCTRCVRFLDTIAGTNELGGMGRGESTEISTYIGKSIESELSGNIIDVCPVGALTNKPFRFRARPWELIAKESIGTHDALGGNLWLHTRRGEILRTVPRDNESLNETWASDRDRYAFQGLYSADRATAPLVRRDGVMVETDWETALNVAVTSLSATLKAHGAAAFGCLVSPRASNEEALLLARFTRALGSENIDHRLRQMDPSPHAPGLGLQVAELETIDSLLLIGSNIRHEIPLLGHRVRKAQRRGGRVCAVNPVDFDFNFDLAAKRIVAPHQTSRALASIAKALLGADGASPPPELQALLNAADDSGAEMAQRLRHGEHRAVLLGHLSARSEDANQLRQLARFIAQLLGASYGELPDGANSLGAWRAGAVPRNGGLDSSAQILAPRKAYLLHNFEPSFDHALGAQASQVIAASDCAIALSAYASPDLLACASVILPICELAESDFSYDNINGGTQTLSAAAKPNSGAKPAWRVLRVLGEMLKLNGFAFDDLASVRADLAGLVLEDAASERRERKASAAPLSRIADVPIYAGDSVLRRASALNQTLHAVDVPYVGIHPEEAMLRGLSADSRALVTSGETSIELSVVIDRDIARGAARIPFGVVGCEALGMGSLEIQRA